MANLYCDRHTDFVQKPDQLRKPRRPETGRQLQPVRGYPLPQRPQQLDEALGSTQLLAQVAAMTDVARKLGGKTKVLRHDLRPALNRGTSRAGIERGVAFYGIEHLAVKPKEVGGFRVGGVQVLAPGAFTPGRATQKIRKG